MKTLNLLALLVAATSCAAPSGSGTDDGGTVDVGDGGVSGLPCDVADVFTKNCVSCHAGTAAAGGGHVLASYEDLMKASTTDPTQTNAQRALARMEDPTVPMPPGKHLAAADIAVVANWIAAGAKKGSCDTGAPDAGFPDSPPTCTSNAYWTRGDRGSANMHPGYACIQCHRSEREGPQGWAGTLFPTNHEPDDCNGEPTRVLVELLDANDRVVDSATSNGVGNFYSYNRVSVPVRARLTAGGRTREMVGLQPTADCNSCHTQDGTQSAPGRIVSP